MNSNLYNVPVAENISRAVVYTQQSLEKMELKEKKENYVNL